MELLDDKFPKFFWEDREIVPMFISNGERLVGFGLKTKDGEPQEGLILNVSKEQIIKLIEDLRLILNQI